MHHFSSFFYDVFFWVKVLKTTTTTTTTAKINPACGVYWLGKNPACSVYWLGKNPASGRVCFLVFLVFHLGNRVYMQTKMEKLTHLVDSLRKRTAQNRDARNLALERVSGGADALGVALDGGDREALHVMRER